MGTPLNNTGVEPLNDTTGVEPLDDTTGVEPLKDTTVVEPLNDTTSVKPLNETGVEPLNDTGVEPLNNTGVEPVNDTGVELHNDTGLKLLNDTGVEEAKKRGLDRVIINEALDSKKIAKIAFEAGFEEIDIRIRGEGIYNVFKVDDGEKLKGLENLLDDTCKSKHQGILNDSNTELYVRSTTNEDAQALLNIEEIEGGQVQTSVSEKKITDKYILKSLNKKYTLENIAKELESQQIPWKEIVRFTKNSEEGTVPIPVILIKEIGKRVQNDIKIFDKTYIKRDYIEKPKICKKCLKFGHYTQNCRGQARCNKCGEEEHKVEDCKETEDKCIRCEQKHNSCSEICPKYIVEREIVNLAKKKNISISEATKKVEEIHSAGYSSGDANNQIDRLECLLRKVEELEQIVRERDIINRRIAEIGERIRQRALEIEDLRQNPRRSG